MPVRLDYATIALNDSLLSLPWTARQVLVDKLASTPGGRVIKTAFDAVGTARPVELTRPEKTELLRILEEWAQVKPVNGVTDVPDGIFELRKALIGDLPV